MSHEDEGTTCEQITACYEMFSRAFANRDADTIMALFLPTYTVTNPGGYVLDYARVEKTFRWETSAEWLHPKAWLFDVQGVQINADGTDAVVTVQVTREGKGAQIFPRRDTWTLTPEGWRLRESVSGDGSMRA